MTAPIARSTAEPRCTRCNRTAFGFMVGSLWVPFLDPKSPADLTARDQFFAHSAG